MIEFEVPGDAVGKARPRFDSRTRRTYTPHSTVLYEKKVRNCLYEKYGTKIEKATGGVIIHIYIDQKIPKSDNKKIRAEKLEGLIPCKHKPDVDNVAKIIMDSLNGILYEDDSQVVELMIKRKWADEASVHVLATQEDRL